ncbi:hypothetical protein PSACC_01282 [Paramicrosporidium saccamoebae]|uniref:Uncharacterized protein n=1 Tax=Paramicrosporidium saccamoebae TaxID=1246581 RepID=A0A2H9TMC4_9FUNG|nr:hypothetical protein PSACC_01282 [Paramicrosporidium saccamoebae]
MHESSEAVATRFRVALSELRAVKVDGLDDVSAKKRLNMTLLELREANRAMSLLVRGRKKVLQSAKNALDRAELSRQNLLYEKRHLEATIEDTRLHDSLYLTISMEDDPAAMDLNEHDLTLHRLQVELETRKRLSENLKSKQDSLELSRSRLVLKRKELEKLRDQLENIIKAAEPFLNTHGKFFVAERIVERESPLNRLGAELVGVMETRNDLQVWRFEELEAGEEEEEEGGEEHLDDDSSLTRSPAEGAPARTHGRFATNVRKVNRRFAHAYILAELALTEGTARLYFYHNDPDATDSLMVIKLELSERDLGRQESESILLSLPLDPILLLTTPHESIVAGEAGHVPFRWLQSLCGLVTDTSFGDPHKVLDLLFSAIETRLNNTMQVDEI